MYRGEYLTVFFLVAGLSVFYLSGCSGFRTDGERQARSDIKTLSETYRPGDQKPELPALDSNVTLSKLILYAILNQPRVETAYYEYAASIEDITLGRSLPDPRITFQANALNIAEYVTGGLMIDVPWPTKLTARAAVATEESQARYYAFERSVLQTALEVKLPYYQLHFLQDRIRINREMLAVAKNLEESARTQNETGKATLQDVLRAQMEQARLKTELSNLEDFRNPLLSKLKAALGLAYGQENPPMPAKFETTTLDVSPDRLYAIALERNPQLKSMEAEVRAAEEGISLARKSMFPDFTVGAESGVMFGSVMVLPKLDVTLPIWRDKIAAEIAAAQARKKAADARFSSEQIQLAVEFADKSYTYREAKRNLELLSGSLIAKARLSLDAAQTAYSSGKSDFSTLIEAERTLLEFQLAEVGARLQCETALTELSVLIGQKPEKAPVIPGGAGGKKQ